MNLFLSSCSLFSSRLVNRFSILLPAITAKILQLWIWFGLLLWTYWREKFSPPLGFEPQTLGAQGVKNTTTPRRSSFESKYWRSRVLVWDSSTSRMSKLWYLHEPTWILNLKNLNEIESSNIEVFKLHWILESPKSF